MKHQFHAFLSGVLVSALVIGTAVSALAISGKMTIEVDPINVQVNGEVFQPTDANGNAVPVFAYNGTTYAPLRALAEAYGLEVGYDAEKNMATVRDPSVAPAETANNQTDSFTIVDASGKDVTAKCQLDTHPIDYDGVKVEPSEGGYPVTISYDGYVYVNFERLSGIFSYTGAFDNDFTMGSDRKPNYLMIDDTHYGLAANVMTGMKLESSYDIESKGFHIYSATQTQQ